jgi:hypothetical protein
MGSGNSRVRDHEPTGRPSCRRWLYGLAVRARAGKTSGRLLRTRNDLFALLPADGGLLRAHNDQRRSGDLRICAHGLCSAASGGSRTD